MVSDVFAQTKPTTVLLLDIEGVMTHGYFTPGRQQFYSAEAYACISTFCDDMGVKLAVLSGESAQKDDAIFKRIDHCRFNSKWLHPDWWMMGNESSKQDAAYSWQRRNQGSFTHAFILEDNPRTFKNPPFRVFTPKDGEGLTRELSLEIAEAMGRRAEFEANFIPPRTRLSPPQTQQAQSALLPM